MAGGTCVITDDSDNRIRAHCMSDATQNGDPVTCDAVSGCISAATGATRRFWDGTPQSFRDAIDAAAGEPVDNFWEWAWDGATFTELGPIPE